MSDGEASVLAVVDNLCTGEKDQVNATHFLPPPLFKSYPPNLLRWHILFQTIKVLYPWCNL